MLFSNSQKKLMLDILKKEQRRLFSKHKGELLDKTISDLAQMVRNEDLNVKDTRDNNVIDWNSRKGR